MLLFPHVHANSEVDGEKQKYKIQKRRSLLLFSHVQPNSEVDGEKQECKNMKHKNAKKRQNSLYSLLLFSHVQANSEVDGENQSENFISPRRLAEPHS